MQTLTDLRIRWALRRDMPEILEIEQQSFTHPWCEDEFLRQWRERNVIGLVAQVGADPGFDQYSPLAGFVFYQLDPGYYEIISLAVHPEYRGCGVGRKMVDRLAGKLSRDRRKFIFAKVRESNLEAQYFFRECGFRAVKVLRGECEDTGEDAYLFMRGRHQ